MTRRNSWNDDVMIAVDPHKASNTAAVLDPVTKTLIESARFANSEDGYAQLTVFARRWAQRRWAARGCHGAGRSLAQRLVADGEAVLDVPAKLAARVRVYSRGHGRKTDKHDAVSVGLAALDGTGVLPVSCDDALVSLRLLCDRREKLTAQRTQAVCRLHRLLAELTPGGTAVARQVRSAALLTCLQAVLVHGGDMAVLRRHRLGRRGAHGVLLGQPPRACSGALRAGSGRWSGGVAGCSLKKRMNSALASGPCASV
jgi:hypothetical protein